MGCGSIGIVFVYYKQNPELLVPYKNSIKAHDYRPSTLGVGAGGWEVEDNSWVHRKVKASLSTWDSDNLLILHNMLYNLIIITNEIIRQSAIL